MSRMTKDELVEKIKELLKTDIDLNFLLNLKKEVFGGTLVLNVLC